MDDRSECARDLVLAIFRLAVADYLGVYYGYDGPVPARARSDRYRQQAAQFLSSGWAYGLAEMSGFSAPTVWREARRQRAKATRLLPAIDAA